jgi:hypothetical protein
MANFSPSRFTPRETASGTHWVGPRASLDVVEKSLLRLWATQPQFLDRLADDPSLYRIQLLTHTIYFTIIHNLLYREI